MFSLHGLEARPRFSLVRTPGRRSTTTMPKRNVDLLSEELITLRQAAKEWPRPPRQRALHYCTLWRYAQRGKGGVCLETCKLGRDLLTSREAIHRFIAALNK